MELLELPLEILHMIAYHLDNHDYINFSLTCKNTYRLRRYSTPCRNPSRYHDHLLIDNPPCQIEHVMYGLAEYRYIFDICNKFIDKLTVINIVGEVLQVTNRIRYLDCSNSSLLKLEVPDCLRYLNCSNTAVFVHNINYHNGELHTGKRRTSIFRKLSKVTNNLVYLNCSHVLNSYYCGIARDINYTMTALEYLDCSYTQSNYNDTLISCENLQYLNCSGNKINKLKIFCPKLKKIICTNTRIVEITECVPSVTYLDCSYSNIAISKFPSLTYLNCSNIASENNIISYTVSAKLYRKSIFHFLTYMNCSNSGITEFNGHLFPALKTLICSNNKIKSLRNVKHIYCLNCSNCGLFRLPDMYVEILNCSNNLIMKLPHLPRLRIIDCANTLIDKSTLHGIIVI